MAFNKNRMIVRVNRQSEGKENNTRLAVERIFLLYLILDHDAWEMQ
jgi:hypothetical protein